MGETLALKCNVTNVHGPVTNLDWFKDGKRISSDDRRPISVLSKVADQIRTVYSTLRVHNLTKKDAGTYMCKVSDQMLSSVQVDVGGKEETTGKLIFVVV